MNVAVRKYQILLYSGLALATLAALVVGVTIYFGATGHNDSAAGAANEPGRSPATPGPLSAGPSVTPGPRSPSVKPSPSLRESASRTTRPPSGGGGGGGGPGPVGWPNATSTGVPAGVTLKRSGSISVTKAGTVISGYEVHGTIDVSANNVTIRNSLVINSGSSDWGIQQDGSAGGLVVEDSEIRGNGTQELQQGILNFGGMLTVRRTDISQISDGIATVHGLIEDNYLHDPRVFPGDHVDMIQATSGPEGGRSLIIRHNTIINTEGQTSAIALFQDFGVAHDVLIQNNLLAGGSYTVYGGEGQKGRSYNIRILDNTFSRIVFPKCGYWGPVAYFDGGGAGNQWSSNVWEGSGATVNP